MKQQRMTAAEFREFQRTGKDPAPAAAPLPDKPKRKPSHSKGEMNKLEASYAQRLDALKHDGTVKLWQFERLTFPLAPNTTFTPDFVVFTSTGIECHEVKGPHVWEDSWVKFKIAAAMYPQFRWFWCTRDSDGWTLKQQ